jgi:site-specific recombinase XerD
MTGGVSMTIKEAIELFKKHQKGAVKKSTIKSYGKFLDEFQMKFSECDVVSISTDDVGKFLEECTENLSRSTRHLRYAQLKAFFNYIIETAGFNIKNPCNAVVLLKAYKNVQHRPRKILDKETVDEIIFNSRSGKKHTAPCDCVKTSPPTRSPDRAIYRGLTATCRNYQREPCLHKEHEQTIVIRSRSG